MISYGFGNLMNLASIFHWWPLGWGDCKGFFSCDHVSHDDNVMHIMLGTWIIDQFTPSFFGKKKVFNPMDDVKLNLFQESFHINF